MAGNGRYPGRISKYRIRVCVLYAELQFDCRLILTWLFNREILQGAVYVFKSASCYFFVLRLVNEKGIITFAAAFANRILCLRFSNW